MKNLSKGMRNRHGMWLLFLISGLITQGAANEPDLIRSVHLTPFPQTVGPLQIPQARTDAWPFELEPQESARYNVTIASSGTSPAPEDHVYNLVPSSIAVGVSPDYNYNILWAWQVSGGGQSYVCDVVNTVWVNNTASVSINCRWERTLTGGSGSGASGLGFDPIYGWALGLATHKQSDFEVSSSVEIDGAPDYLCVNEMIDLYAWLVIGEFPYDNSQLVDAVWSVESIGSSGGSGFFLEEMETTIATFVPTDPGLVRVTATVPNSSPTLTDSVEFTIVHVEIETEDEPGNLICVGGTKGYTAAVTPANVAGPLTFTWSVNNEEKLGFVDDDNTGQTVTVTGLDSSVAVDAEELTVEFRINNEMICEPSTNLTVFELDIDKVLSDQFSGADVNLLPPIGSQPAANIPMLMGCAAGSTAQVKVEATVQPAGLAGTTYLGARKEGTTSILNSVLINSGGQTSLFWENTEGDVVFEIVGGADLNGDGYLDVDEVCDVYEDGARAINESEYNDEDAYLGTLGVGGGIFMGYNTAADILSWFLNNTDSGSSVSLSDTRLTHPVGVQWTGTTGTCSKYNFSNCPRVVWSTEFKNRLIAQAFADHGSFIGGYFADNPGDTHVFGPWSCTLPNFEFPNSGNAYDKDMYYAFKNAGIVTVTSYRLKIKDVPAGYDILGREAVGYFYDLYDFAYGSGTLATRAAKVQAGYPSLGTAGRVFQVDRVNFNGSSGSMP